MKLKSYDKDTKWIVDDEGKLIATIDALMNGRWVIQKDGKRISASHETPRAAFNAFKASKA